MGAGKTYTKVLKVRLPQASEIRVYSVRSLREIVYRSPRTIYLWEEQGKIPKPIFRESKDSFAGFGDEHIQRGLRLGMSVKGGSKETRWYTANELEVYLVCMGQYSPGAGKVCREQHEFFMALRVNIMKLREDFISGAVTPYPMIPYERFEALRRMYGMMGIYGPEDYRRWRLARRSQAHIDKHERMKQQRKKAEKAFIIEVASFRKRRHKGGE